MSQAYKNPPQPPVIPTGRELYDAIMGHIEPELTTEGIKLLAETYKDETPEQNKERKKRYQMAFDRYQQAYEGYVLTMAGQMERYRRESFAAVELEDREHDETFLEKLQKTILQLA